MAETQKGHRVAKVMAGICLGLMGLLLVAFAGVNAFVRIAYAGFYDHASREFDIPGISEGFVPQDLDHLDDGTWLFSGYMADGSESAIYRLGADGTSGRFFVSRPDGSAYDGHGSGITSDGEHVLLTDGDGFLAFDLASVEAVEENGRVQAIGRRSLEFAPAFLNIEDGALYLGDFYHPGPYETPDAHRMQTPAGDENPAVMYAYPEDEMGTFGYADQAARVYSIPARIQGMCITDAGSIVLSQSYGLATSHLLVYDAIAAEGANADDWFVADGRTVPLFYLDSACEVADVDAPPMTEGIEWHDGGIFISCESASDKYLFGKLYGAGAVYALWSW